MIRPALPVAALLLLGGCAAGPGRLPVAADVALPPAFTFAPETATAGGLASLLPSDDPAFQALASAALADSPALGAALARVEAARAGAARARAERFPQVDGGLAVERSRSSAAQVNAPAIPGVAADLSRTTFGASLAAKWDADLFGQLRARQRAATERLDAAGAEAAAVRLALAADIAAAVVDWRTLDARAERLARDVEAADRLARLAGVRENAGIAPGADRVEAQAVAAAGRRALAALETERAPILGQLVALTARPAPEIIAALGLPAAARPLSAPPTLPSTVLAERPDVLAAGARLRAASADVAAAAAQRFPRLSLSSMLGVLALGIGGLFDSDSITGSLGADLAGPLLDFGRVGADIDRAEAATSEAFADYRRAVFGALGDAESGYMLVAAADREMAAAIAERALADRAADLAATRNRAGLISLLAVLDARRRAFAAGDRAAAAEGRARRARIALWQALGGSVPSDPAPQAAIRR